MLNIPDECLVYSDDIEDFILKQYKLSSDESFWGIVRPMQLELEIGDYTWSEFDETGHKYAEAEVIVTFPDGSAISKDVLFKRPNHNMFVKPNSTEGYIYTGLTLDYSYEFEISCYLDIDPLHTGDFYIIGSGGSSRLTSLSVHVYSSYDEFLCFWGPNTYTRISLTNLSQNGIDITKQFRVVVNCNTLTFYQGETTFPISLFASTSSGVESYPIVLFNWKLQSSPAVPRSYVEYIIIRDSNGNELRHFVPEIIDHEVVIVDTANNRNIYKPNKGELIIGDY